MRTKVVWVAVAVLVAVLAAAIVVGYVSRDLDRYEPGVARLEGYALGDTPTQVIVFFATGAGDVVEGPLVNEDAAKVMVTVRTSVFVPGRGRFKDLSATLGRTTVTLREPLGDRAVIDTATGRVLPRQPAQP